MEAEPVAIRERRTVAVPARPPVLDPLNDIMPPTTISKSKECRRPLYPEWLEPELACWLSEKPPGSANRNQLKFERVITPAVRPVHAVSPAQELQRLAGEIVMPHYLFHLSDEENTYFDDTGKQLEDSRAAHAHALRIIEKVRAFIPDADKSTWRIRITLPTGQSVMTVVSRAVREAPQKPFGKRSGACLALSIDEQAKGQPA